MGMQDSITEMRGKNEEEAVIAFGVRQRNNPQTKKKAKQKSSGLKISTTNLFGPGLDMET